MTKKPVLWVSVTSYGEQDAERNLADVEQRVKEAAGDDYEVVVASDKVRLATVEDLERLEQELQRLRPSDIASKPADAAEKRQERTGYKRPAEGEDGQDEAESDGQRPGQGTLDLEASADEADQPDTEVEEAAEDLEWDEEDADQGELEGLEGYDDI